MGMMYEQMTLVFGSPLDLVSFVLPWI